jgi:hypothetical protein
MQLRQTDPMQLRQRGYTALDERLWRRVCWLAPVAGLDARDFKQAAWEIGLGNPYREQLDAVADMVGESELCPCPDDEREVVELLVNILLRFLVRVAYTQMLKQRRKPSNAVTSGDHDKIDEILLHVACDELRQSQRLESEVVRVLGRILDAIAEVSDRDLADALVESFKYVYGEAPLPDGRTDSPTLHDIATSRELPPATLRNRIHRLLKDIRLPADLRDSRSRL